MKIGVLGGGLVGLVVASQCRQHESEVLESESRGHCWKLGEEGYTFDLGGAIPEGSVVRAFGAYQPEPIAGVRFAIAATKQRLPTGRRVVDSEGVAEQCDSAIRLHI
jgi:hypothetical protein